MAEAEARAVERLREELEKCNDFSEKVNMLSIKVKWGQQEDMKDIGNLRQFLTKYPDVFTCDGVSVKLSNPPEAPLTTAKGKAPPPSKASFGPKVGGGIFVPKPSTQLAQAVPKKRGFGDLAGFGADDVDAKAARRYPDYNDYNEQESMHPSSPPGLDSGRPSSKAAANFGASDKGGYKGCKDKDNGKNDKGYHSQQSYASKGAGKVKGNPFEEAEVEEDVGMESFEGDKGAGKNEKGFNGKSFEKGKDFNGKGDKDQSEKGFKGGKGAGKGEEYGMQKDGMQKDGMQKGGMQKDGMQKDGGKQKDDMHPSGAPTSKAKWGGAKPPQAINMVVTPQDRKRMMLADSLQPQEAHRGIEAFKTNGTEIELGKLANTLRPSDEARSASKRCMALLLAATNKEWPNQNGAPTIELYGSYAQGTELQGSSMDVAFRLQAESSSEEKEKCIRGLRERLSNQANFFEVFESLQHYPHTESPVSVELKGATPRLVVNIVVTQKLVDRSTKLDSIIKQLCDSHEATHDLVRLVKLWSVNHGLEKHRDGYMNGVAWTLLVLFFMQEQKLIPPFSSLAQNQPFTPPSSQMSLATLLYTFFDFLSKRGATDLRGISVYSGEQFPAPSVFIEDPTHFEETRQQRSLCDSLAETQWARCVEEAKKAANRIGVRPQRWFHWAEVFDPTERTNVKHPGLAQFLAGIETVPQDSAKGGDKGKGVPPGKGKDSYGMVDVGGKDSCGKGKDGVDGKGKDIADGKGKDSADGKGKDSLDGKGKDGADGKGKDGLDGKGKDGADGKGKDGLDGKGKDSMNGKGKDSMDGKGKDDFFGKGKDSSFSKGKDDSFGKGKDDSFGKGGADSLGKGKEDAYGKGKDDSYGKGKDDKGDSYGKGKNDYQDDQDSCGKGKDSGKGKDFASGKGKSESYGKGKDMSYGKGDDYSSKGKGGKPY